MTSDEKRDKYYRKKYGVGLDWYNTRLREQNYSCAICQKHQSNFKKRLAIDHNHRSGKVRSLLCMYCNRRRVGQLTLEWAKKIYEYLLKYDG